MLKAKVVARVSLRHAVHPRLNRHFYNSTMPSSSGIISLENIPSWYDHYQKQSSTTQEDSEYSFDEKLNKRVALIVGTSCGTHSLIIADHPRFQVTSPSFRFAESLYQNTDVLKGFHTGRYDRQCRKQQSAGRRRSRWGDTSCCRARIIEGMQNTQWL
jgi:hypothetical protein